jgi:hypothetical protein
LAIEQIMVELPANDAASVIDGAPEPRAGGAYDAFISYSHAKDKPVATALQAVVQKLGKPWYQRRALRVFRDDASLSATPHLWPSIEQALAQSRFLILLASREAAASRWVGQEIAYWLDHNSADSVLIALTEGELDWDEAAGDFRWSEAAPLPAALRNRFTDEPRWIDLRPYRGSPPKGIEFMGLAADFAAAIRGIPKEDLLSEEVRQQRRFQTLGWTVGAALVALLIAFGWQWRAAETQRASAETQRGIAETQTKIAEAQRKEAQIQRNEAQLQRDKARIQLLAVQARRADADARSPYDIERAGALALESIQIARKSNLPAEADAIEVARSALIRLPLATLEHGSRIRSLAKLVDGRLVSGGGANGDIKIWPKDGRGEPVVLGHGDEVSSLAVLADGRLAGGDNDGNINIWPMGNTGESAVLSNGDLIKSLAVLVGGRLASADYGGAIKLWPKDGKGEPVVVSDRANDTFLDGAPPWLRALSDGPVPPVLAALPDGRLAGGEYDGTIKIWPKDGSGEPIVLSHGNREVLSLGVLADERLASGSTDGTIKIWPKEGTGEPIVLLHGSQVEALAVLADGRLASGGQDGPSKSGPTTLGANRWSSRTAGRSDPWRCWWMDGWSAVAPTATSESGLRRVPANRWSCRKAARSCRWRCWRTGGWRARA